MYEKRYLRINFQVCVSYCILQVKEIVFICQTIVMVSANA